MPTIYRVIARDDNKVQQFRTAYDVSIFLLGRRITAYLIIKSDNQGDRLIAWPSDPNIEIIETHLESS